MHEPSPLVEVPHSRLSPEALRGVVVEFVTRDGTDYGAHERLLEEKIADVMRQLERGEARIMADLDAGTVHVVPVR